MIDFTNANPLPAVEVYKKRLGISWTKKTDSRQKNQWVKSLCPMDRVMVIEKRGAGKNRPMEEKRRLL